jgi:hypothetical protein
MFLEHYTLGWCTRLSSKYEATSPSWISSPPPSSENPPPLPPSGAPPGSDRNQGGELSATCPRRIRRLMASDEHQFDPREELLGP